VKRDAWNRRYAGTELVWTAEPNRFLVAEAGALPAGRALDLACGEGRNAVWLARHGWDVTGVDFADTGLEKARRLAAASGVEATWVHADLLEYDPPAEAFDLVAILYLQLPEGDRRRVLRAAAAAVAPGGTLLVVAHDRSNLEHGHGGPQDAAVLATPEEVAGDLDGLEVERAEVVERRDGDLVALDLLVRARRA
jgi:2-polyprenyl-3-methyl-5-hydroxy-6-metoxy-1,4-benzoquinol methylase